MTDTIGQIRTGARAARARRRLARRRSAAPRGPRRRRGAADRGARLRRAVVQRDADQPRAALAVAASLLGATERIAVATGIASIWSRDALAARNGALGLAEVHPGRFTLGLGVSHAPAVELRGQDYNKPLTAMRDYLEASTRADRGAGVERRSRSSWPRCARRCSSCRATATAGAHPYFVPVEHTAIARERLGPSRCWRPRSRWCWRADAGRGARPRPQVHGLYLSLPNYTNNLRDLGWCDDDLAGGGSDALVDAIVGWGDVDRVAALVARTSTRAPTTCASSRSSDRRGRRGRRAGGARPGAAGLGRRARRRERVA